MKSIKDINLFPSQKIKYWIIATATTGKMGADTIFFLNNPKQKQS